MNSSNTQQQKNKRTLGALVLLVCGMFGFGFALVPLYDLICEVTGTQSIALRSEGQTASPWQGDIDTSRTVTIKFDATVNPNVPWAFTPQKRVMEVYPGKVYEVNFDVQNRSSQAVSSQAIPSVAPWQATAFLSKLECFCFNQQTLQGGESVIMPLRFVVTPDLPKDIHSLTLSYSLLRLKPSQETAAVSMGETPIAPLLPRTMQSKG